MPLRLDATAAGFETAFRELLASKREDSIDVNETVAAILADVRKRGDAALIDYTRRFDRFALTAANLRIEAAEISEAETRCDPEELAALRLASERIRDYHQRQLPENLDYTDSTGVRLGHRWTPVSAAGLYVPGGLASYPSSVLMNAIPAAVAGAERVVMVVPTPDGVINPLVLAAARLSGVTEAYRVGGAQAVAALAYGTERIAPVDKIVGPGNAYVAAAKKQVFGTVGIDMIAGPSEILVIADAKNEPRWIAADLLSQAEHDTAAQSILITDDAQLAGAVERAVEVFLQSLERTEIAKASWEQNGAIILVPDLKTAVDLSNRVAPEHLELAVEDPDTLAKGIRHAGAIFLGRRTPEAIGDYIAGPNHVLPTARSARFSSGLSVLDFLKRSSLISCSADGLRAIGPSAVALARAEGLGAHALSISVRLEDDETA